MVATGYVVKYTTADITYLQRSPLPLKQFQRGYSVFRVNGLYSSVCERVRLVAGYHIDAVERDLRYYQLLTEHRLVSFDYCLAVLVKPDGRTAASDKTCDKLADPQTFEKGDDLAGDIRYVLSQEGSYSPQGGESRIVARTLHIAGLQQADIGLRHLLRQRVFQIVQRRIHG